MWKQVSGYENAYKINEYGQIMNSKGLILKPLMRKDGYTQYTLCKKGIRKSLKTHRLVATHFVVNPRSCNVVNHKDGDKLNNYYLNLEWCTSSENNQHAWDIGLKVSTKKQRESARKIIEFNRSQTHKLQKISGGR